MDNTTKFPLWFTILTIVLIVSNFFIFGLFSLIHPELPWPDLGKTEAAFPIQFFAIRHIAFAVPLLHGLIRKEVTVLKTCYTIFLIIAVLDVAMLAVNGYYIPVLVKFVGDLPLAATLLISTTAFIIPMAVSLRFLSKLKTH